MPMYDFQCVTCGHIFEEVASINTLPACPVCKSSAVERLLAAPSLKTNPMPFKVGPVRPFASRPQGGCSRSGCGSCGSKE